MYIGIDIGGTRTRLASSSRLDSPQISDRKEFSTSDSFDENFQEIVGYIDSKKQIEGIGISIPGDLSPDKSTVIKNAHHTSCYLNSLFKKLLSEKYGCPVQMDNDGAVGALGEAVYGNGKGIDFAYITWGTGIGGALVKFVNEKPTVSQLDLDKYLLVWEKACGGENIEKLYGKSADQLTDIEWSEVFESFRKELRDFVDKIHPQRVIFGGGISVSQSSRLLQISCPGVTIEITGLGEDTGLFGAFALIR
jgi:hypothetical protein